MRISADEVAEFAREQDLQLLALEGTRTQYMWTTMRKPASERRLRRAAPVFRRITNAHNSEPVAPARGRFASVTAWVRICLRKRI